MRIIPQSLEYRDFPAIQTGQRRPVIHSLPGLRLGLHGPPGTQFFQDVVGSLHQPGPLFDQLVAAPGHRAVHRTGNGEHFPALFQCGTGRNQRTALQAGLHHQHTPAKATDNPVTLGEVGGPGLGAGRVFRDNQAVFDNPVCQLPVLGGIQPVEPATHHGHGRMAGIQGTCMGGTINTQRQAAGHQQPPPAQLGSELPGMVQARTGGVATAHHANLVLQQQAGIAQCI